MDNAANITKGQAVYVNDGFGFEGPGIVIGCYLGSADEWEVDMGDRGINAVEAKHLSPR